MSTVSPKGNEGTLFANYDEFQKAAIYAHKNFLSKKYNNGLHNRQWQNQRTVVQLEDDSIISLEAKYIMGITEAVTLSKEKEAARVDEDDVIPLVTLDEIVHKYNTDHAQDIKEGKIKSLNKEDVGNINIELIEEKYKSKIKKVVHRPNHDTTHSIRAAAFIVPIHNLLNAGAKGKGKNIQLDDKHIEKLQLMMLFSVLGREDETGFADSKKTGASLYQSYRAVDAIEFLKYCLTNWDHYSKVFKDKNDLYQAALIVELMGFPKMPKNLDKLKPPPVFSVLMKGYSAENLEELKMLINEKYPNNNILRSYTDDDFKGLFPQNEISPEFDESEINLFYMNSAHGIDLLRCYSTGDPKKYAEGLSTLPLVDEFYDLNFTKMWHQGQQGAKSVAKETIEFFKFSRQLLNQFGEKKASDVELDESKLAELTKNATNVENIIIPYLSNSNPPPLATAKEVITLEKGGAPQTMSFGEFIGDLNLESTLLDEYSDPGSQLGIVSRYIASKLLKPGDLKIKKERFDYCHYLSPSQLGTFIDFNNNEHRDFNKDVTLIMKAIDNVPRPEFTQITQYAIIPKIEFVGETTDRFSLHFKKKEEAQLFLDFMHSKGELLDVKNITIREDGGGIATISTEQFNKIESQLEYRTVTPPKEHNEEASMINADGEVAALALIKNCNALIRSVNTSPGTGGNPDYDWYLDQLENPVEIRPVPLKEDLGDRRIYKDQRTAQVYKREFREYTPPALQRPITTNPKQSVYWDEAGKPIPKAIHKERGRAKNTIFTKKISHSLIRPDGKMIHYKPSDKKYLPIGFLSDVNETHLHGERYIWRENVTSKERFWVGKFAERGHPSDDRIQARGKGISLKQLQRELRNDSEENPLTIPHWNELLAGGAKTAVKALYAPEDSLLSRLNLLQSYLRIRDKYGIDVPLIILDGVHPPKIYSETKIREDLKEALTLFQKDSFPFIKDKSRDLQKEILSSLFKTISGSADLNDISYLDDNIEAMLRKINLIGGKSREMQYMEKQWGKGKEAQESCFIRACSLGYPEIVDTMIKKGFDFTNIINKALPLANNNGHSGVVNILLKEFEALKEKLVKLNSEDLTSKVPRADATQDERKTYEESLQLYEKIKKSIDDNASVIERIKLEHESKVKTKQAEELFLKAQSMKKIVSDLEMKIAEKQKSNQPTGSFGQALTRYKARSDEANIAYENAKKSAEEAKQALHAIIKAEEDRKAEEDKEKIADKEKRILQYRESLAARRQSPQIRHKALRQEETKIPNVGSPEIIKDLQYESKIKAKEAQELFDKANKLEERITSFQPIFNKNPEKYGKTMDKYKSDSKTAFKLYEEARKSAEETKQALHAAIKAQEDRKGEEAKIAGKEKRIMEYRESLATRRQSPRISHKEGLSQEEEAKITDRRKKFIEYKKSLEARQQSPEKSLIRPPKEDLPSTPREPSGKPKK